MKRIRGEKEGQRVAFVAALGSFLQGYYLVNISVLAPIYMNESTTLPHFITSSVLAILTSCLPFSAIFGALISNSLSDWKSPRLLLIYLDIIACFSILIQNYSFSFLPLFFGRLIMGLVIGINSILIPKYIYSVCPISMTGSLGSFHQLLIMVGITIGYLMSFCKSPHVIISVPLPICIIRILIFSLYFTYNIRYSGQKDHIIHKLQQYYYKIVTYLQARSSRISLDIVIEQNNLEEENKDIVRLKQQKSEFSRLTACYVLVISNQVCAINAITFFAKQLFEDIFGSNQNGLISGVMVCMGFVQICAVWVAGKRIDAINKKLYLIIGECIMLLSLWCIYLLAGDSNPNNILITLLILIHVAAYNISIGQLMMYYCTLLLKNNSLIIVLNWILTFLIALSTNTIISTMGVGGMCQYFAYLLALCIVILVILLPSDQIERDQGERELEEIFQLHQPQFEENQTKQKGQVI